jgi:hypothetical protein
LIRAGQPPHAAQRYRRTLRRFSRRFTRYSLGLASLSGRCLVDLPTGIRNPDAANATTPSSGRRCRRVAERLRRQLGQAERQARTLAAGPRQPPQTRRTGCGARDETRREVAVGCRLPCSQPVAVESALPLRRRRSCSAWFARAPAQTAARPAGPRACCLRRHRPDPPPK